MMNLLSREDCLPAYIDEPAPAGIPKDPVSNFLPPGFIPQPFHGMILPGMAINLLKGK